ncbi:carboxypeptidase regulatory-like domain-containing protein [bacterium]|nr:carboxypeptidase regulatory-like domain-containing protein [candidate division CSSED10-310 bacterium]
MMTRRLIFILSAVLSLNNPAVTGSGNRSAHILGMITDTDTGSGAGGIDIWVFDADWNFLSDASTRSDPDGRYVTGGLDAGRYYLRAHSSYPMPYVPEYWFDSRDRGTAVPVELEDGIDVSGIDFDLQPGGYVLGTIRTLEGAPLNGVDLDVYSQDWSWITAYSCRSRSDGSYYLGPLPAGNYFIRSDPDTGHGCQQRYWQDAYYREDAAFVAVYPRQEITGIHFQLPPGGAVTGTVYRNTGDILTECEVRLYSPDWKLQPIHQAVSGIDGSYLAFGLPSGSYYLEAVPVKGCGWSRQYYPSGSETGNAILVEVSTQQPTTGVDFNLPEGNFDIDVELDLPATHFAGSDPFYLDLIVRNGGVPLADLPVFVLLEAFGDYYFWPSWCRFEPSGDADLDFSCRDLATGTNVLVIFQPFTWPETGVSGSGLQFIAAVVNWSFTDLAGNVAAVEWSFR